MSKLTKGMYKLCDCKAQDVCPHAFWVGYKPKGKARHRASVDDLAGRQVRKLGDAIKVQTAFKHAIDENRYVPKRALKAGDPTFREAMDAYIEHRYVGSDMIIVPRHVRKRAADESYLEWLHAALGEFARDTASDPDLVMRAHADRQRLAIPRRLVKRWGPRPVTSLTADDGVSLKRELQQPVGDGERLLAVATINRICSVAAAFGKWGTKHGPAKDTKFFKTSPFVIDGESVLENDSEDNVPDRRVTIQEEARLIQAAREAGYTMLACLIPFAIDSMLRKSEVRRLKVSDVTARAGWVRVIGTMRAGTNRAKRLTLRKGARVNKTGKTRNVPICTDRMQAIIDRQLADATGRLKGEDEYLFCDGTGTRPAPDWAWQWEFTKLRAHGVPLKFVYEEQAGITKHVPGCRRRFGRPAPGATCPRCLELAGGAEPRARRSNRHGSKLSPECRSEEHTSELQSPI